MLRIAKMLRNRKGFTLVELMVVIVIIGILAAIAVPTYTNIQDVAKVKADGATALTICATARNHEVVSGAVMAELSDLAADFGGTAPSPQSGGTFVLSKSGSKYVVTWTPTVTTDYITTQTVTEGTVFTPAKSS